jgi:hypothetical protein
MRNVIWFVHSTQKFGHLAMVSGVVMAFVLQGEARAQSGLESLLDAVKKAESNVSSAQSVSDEADASAAKAVESLSSATASHQEKLTAAKSAASIQTAALKESQAKAAAARTAAAASATANRAKTSADAAASAAKAAAGRASSALSAAESAASSASAAVSSAEKSLSTASASESSTKLAYLEALAQANKDPRNSKLIAIRNAAKTTYDKAVAALRSATFAVTSAKAGLVSRERLLATAKSAASAADARLASAEAAAASASKAADTAASNSSASSSAAAEAAKALSEAQALLKAANADVANSVKSLAAARTAAAKAITAAKVALARLVAAKKAHATALAKYEDALALARETSDPAKFDFENAFHQYVPDALGWFNSEGQEFIFFPSSELYHSVECAFLPKVQIEGGDTLQYLPLKETVHPFKEQSGYLFYLEQNSGKMANEVHTFSCRAQNPSGEQSEYSKSIKMDTFLDKRAVKSDLENNGPCGFEADGVTHNAIFNLARASLKPVAKFPEISTDQPYSVTLSTNSGEIKALQEKFSTRKSLVKSLDDKMILVLRHAQNPVLGCHLAPTRKQLIRESGGSLFWFRSLKSAYEKFGIKSDAQQVGTTAFNSNAIVPYAFVMAANGKAVLIGLNAKNQPVILKSLTRGDRYLSRLFQEVNVNFPTY